MTAPQRVEIYDTTLRDGSQLEGISFTVAPTRPSWRALHRGRLARGEPQRRRVLPSSSTRTRAEELNVCRLWFYSSATRPYRPGPDAAEPDQRGHVHGLHRWQVLGLPRHRSTAHGSRRGCRHGPRVGGASEGQRSRGVLRCGACFRRLQEQPRVQPAGARSRSPSRGNPPRLVRHQRWFLAVTSSPDRQRDCRLLRWRRRYRCASAR